MRSGQMRRGLAAAAVLAMASGMAMAQAQPSDLIDNPSTAAHRRAPQSAGPLVSVEFKGGSLADLAGAIRAASREPVNISLQGEAAAIAVDPMSLKNVSIESALRAALGDRINNVEQLDDGRSVFVMLKMVQSSDTDAPVYVVTARPADGNRPGRDQAVEVYSVQRLISGDNPISPDVVLTAIDTGLGLDGDPVSKPQIRFHKDSGLVLIRGRPGDVKLAGDIVSRMANDRERATSDAARRRAAEIDRRARRGQAAVQLELSEAEIAGAKDRLARTTKLVEGGQESAEVMAKAQMDLRRAEASRNMAHIDLQRVEEEAEAGLIEGRGASSGGGAGGGSGGGAGGDPRDAKIDALERRIVQLEAELAKAREQGGKKTSR